MADPSHIVPVGEGGLLSPVWGQPKPETHDRLTVRRRSSIRPPSRPDGTESEEDWIVRMWNRMDRNIDGSITRAELDCEDFHNVVLSAIAPSTSTGTGGATYTRSQLNMREAIMYCLRKADFNDDRQLSFAEFRALLKSLVDPELQPQGAHLAFSLFDLDYSHSIDKKEFREVMRFFMGHNPTELEFQEEWGRLAVEGQAVEVTREDYIRWLQTTPNPVFRQHAPAGDVVDLGPGTAMSYRPRWNKRFNASVNPLHMNDYKPQGLREYFSTTQSLPELRRFYNTYPDTFRTNRVRLDTAPPPEPRSALWPKSVSTEGGTPLMLPHRHEPRGSMRDHETGQPMLWDDNWSPPVRLKSRFRPGDKPYAARALFGELTDVFALSREGIGVKPEKQVKRRSTRVPGGAVLGGVAPPRDRGQVRAARKTLLEAEPW